jgi:hypothetical protein
MRAYTHTYHIVVVHIQIHLASSSILSSVCMGGFFCMVVSGSVQAGIARIWHVATAAAAAAAAMV